MRIDPQTNTVVATIELDDKLRGGPVIWDEAAWVSTKSALVRIDGATNEAREIAPFGVENLYAGDEGLWVVEPEAVSKHDPEDGRPIASVKLPGAVWPADIAFGEGSLWVVDGEREVWRVDAKRAEVLARVPVGNLATTIKFTDGAAWVAGPGHEFDPTLAGCSVVYRIDTATNEVVATLPLADQGSAVIETHEGQLWSRPEPGVLARIDLTTNAVDEVLTGLPDVEYAGDVASGFGSLWAANWTEGTVWRIDP